MQKVSYHLCKKCPTNRTLININKEENFLFYIFFCVCFSALIAILWEMFEFIGDSLFNLNVQHSLDTGVTDTMQDIILAMIASSFSAIFYYFMNKNKVYN